MIILAGFLARSAGATLATAETYAELAAGKAVFVNFFAPYVRACAHSFPSIPTPLASTRRAADPRAMTNFKSQQILKGILPMTNDNTIFLLSSNAPTRRGREQLATPFSARASEHSNRGLTLSSSSSCTGGAATARVSPRRRQSYRGRTKRISDADGRRP